MWGVSRVGSVGAPADEKTAAQGDYTLNGYNRLVTLMDARQRFQELLRMLFQFDCQELDFGVYRILNLKRQQIEEFITQKLPQIVDEAFQSYAQAEQEQIDQELRTQRAQLEQKLGKDAFENGELKPQLRELPLAEAYYEALRRKQQAQIGEELKIQIYNDLYNFFSRYYEDGDFIAKRRYDQSKTPYLLPYHGEEVLLYWATRDQYYVKTGEQFKHYRFKLGEYTVEFALREASTELNNLKSQEKRFFLPATPQNLSESIHYNPDAKQLTLFFVYRPLTSEEQQQFGSRENQRPQEQINEYYAATLLQAAQPLVPIDLHALLQKDNALQSHLTRFTRRNTTDYFIHKNLKSFLEHELDLYLKTHCLPIDELLYDESHLRQNLRRAKVVRKITRRLIEFLHQIESFQKRLFEKKKFVIETHFVATLDKVPRELWDEVLANEAQQAEWQALGFTDRPLTRDDLNHAAEQPTLEDDAPASHPRYRYLSVDTRHFPPDFAWKLLHHWDNLDEQIDGVLIHSENFQALRLLQTRYREQIKCIYIDPPYNTKASEILYLNGYKDSSWLSLMHNRITESIPLLSKQSVYVIAIDEVEQTKLGEMLSVIFPDRKIVCTTVVHNQRGQQGTNFSSVHEYAYFVYPDDNHKYIENRTLDEVDRRNLRDSGSESARTDAANCFYPIIVKEMKVVGFGDVPLDDFHPVSANEQKDDGCVYVWPIDTNGNERKWRYARQSVEQIADFLEVVNSAHGLQIYFNKSLGTVRTVWQGAAYDASEYGTKVLQSLFSREVSEAFKYPKSIHLVEDTLKVSGLVRDTKGIALDFFAGSGTTGHAVLNLNRRDGGRRKFILVEQERYFDTVLLPRLKKVLFSDKWREGKPEADGQGLSGVLMYHRLEQYEDTLNNLELTRAAEGSQAYLEFGDEYLLRYMLAFETEGSCSLMNPAEFTHPLNYRLRVIEGDEQREREVDLLWTFNYLLGLKVVRLRRFERAGVEYRAVLGERGGKRIAVVWRNACPDEAWLQADLAFIINELLPALNDRDAPAERVYINSPHIVPNARAIEPLFRRLMFGGEG